MRLHQITRTPMRLGCNEANPSTRRQIWELVQVENSIHFFKFKSYKSLTLCVKDTKTSKAKPYRSPNEKCKTPSPSQSFGQHRSTFITQLDDDDSKDKFPDNDFSGFY